MIALDHGERDGFQFPSKARAFQEWLERKEAAEFQNLCVRLRVRRRYMEIMAEGPGSPRYENLRAGQRAWAREHRASETARVKEWRLRKRVRAAVVITCGGPGCRLQWSPVPTRGTGKYIRYCSKACENAARAKRVRERAAERAAKAATE